MDYLKKVVIFAAIVGLGYFLLSTHFIIIDKSVKMLKKSTLSLNYTIFSADGKPVEKILDIDDLREDGIGDLLVEEGLVSEEKLKILLSQYEYED